MYLFVKAIRQTAKIRYKRIQIQINYTVVAHPHTFFLKNNMRIQDDLPCTCRSGGQSIIVEKIVQKVVEVPKIIYLDRPILVEVQRIKEVELIRQRIQETLVLHIVELLPKSKFPGITITCPEGAEGLASLQIQVSRTVYENILSFIQRNQQSLWKERVCKLEEQIRVLQEYNKKLADENNLYAQQIEDLKIKHLGSQSRNDISQFPVSPVLNPRKQSMRQLGASRVSNFSGESNFIILNNNQQSQRYNDQEETSIEFCSYTAPKPKLNEKDLRPVLQLLNFSKSSKKLPGVSEFHSKTERITSNTQRNFSLRNIIQTLDSSSAASNVIIAMVIYRLLEKVGQDICKGIYEAYKPQNIHVLNLDMEKPSLEEIRIKLSDPIKFCQKTTKTYLAPEVLKREPAKPQSCVYNLGVLWDEMINKSRFFTNYRDVLNSEVEYKMRASKMEETGKLIEQMVERDVKKRVRLQDVQSWVQSYLDRQNASHSNKQNQ